jgi:cell wall-associated NlpC family hydrolase
MFRFAILATFLIASHAQATPSGSLDEVDQLLPDRGLLTKMEIVSQSVGLKASELVFAAMGFLGAPYRAGGDSGETGFDCSGFVRAIFGKTIGLETTLQRCAPGE